MYWAADCYIKDLPPPKKNKQKSTTTCDSIQSPDFLSSEE